MLYYPMNYYSCLYFSNMIQLSLNKIQQQNKQLTNCKMTVTVLGRARVFESESVRDKIRVFELSRLLRVVTRLWAEMIDNNGNFTKNTCCLGGSPTRSRSPTLLERAEGWQKCFKYILSNLVRIPCYVESTVSTDFVSNF